MGFSHTHLRGTGCADLGDLLVMPLTGPLNTGKDYHPLERRWITHAELARGGTLEFQMGLLSNKEWGTKLNL